MASDLLANGSCAREQLEIPAAQSLAQVVLVERSFQVRLPPRFAKAAVEQFLLTHRAIGQVIEGPYEPNDGSPALRDEEWMIRVVTAEFPLNLSAAHRVPQSPIPSYRFPKYSIAVSRQRSVDFLLSALEEAKPEELDEDGRPLPWVPVRPVVKPLSDPSTQDENDAVLVEDTELTDSDLETDPDPELAGYRPIADQQIHDAFERLARVAGFEPPPPLTLIRGIENRHGFTTGVVHYTREFKIRRVRLTTCPNSDWAEIMATAAHELAHPLSRTTLHGLEFKRSLVDLASRYWGEQWFAEARARLDGPSAVVDYWIASGIRATESKGEVPMAKTGDDGQMARIVSRIRKLRELAKDQMGAPEGITATALANDLITIYGLGDYGVRIDAAIHDQMVDRWIVLGDSARWRASLVHAVSHYFDVFTLTSRGQPRVHLFGKYSDIVAAEYLYNICSERIARECAAYLENWKRQAARRPGEALRQRASFCSSAVWAFQKKLDALLQLDKKSGASAANDNVALVAAEDFAHGEYRKRGRSWGAGRRGTVILNEAGTAVGSSLEVVRGVSSGGEPKRVGF